MTRLFSKVERSWILYDWANSAYTITITTALFPLFFGQIARAGGMSDTDSTALLGISNSLYAIIIAILAPILGTFADYKGAKKKFFSAFMVMGVVATAMMVIIGDGMIIPAMVLYIISAMGFAGANIFYDSFLIDVTTEERIDQVSANGFAWGYVGSTIPFVISIGILALFGFGEDFSLNPIGMKVALLMTASWWFLFSIPFLLNVHQKFSIPNSKTPIRDSFSRLMDTFKSIRRYKHAFVFLLAYFFYIDGVDTIIKMAVDFGSKMGISSIVLMIDLVGIQLVAFPFAILYGRLAKKFGARSMLFAGIGVYLLITTIAFFLPFLTEGMVIPVFLIMSFLVATSQGGIQALSRSWFGTLIPKEKSGEFFGFFNIFGKFAAILGPLLMGLATKISGSFSIGIGSIVILFIFGGGILLYTVRLDRLNQS